MGKLQEAAGQLEQARRIDPKDKSAYSHLAVAYRRLGQLEKAREVLSTLHEINAQEREDLPQRMAIFAQRLEKVKLATAGGVLTNAGL